MSDIKFTEKEPEDNINEKELIDIFNSIDDDLINRQIEELLAEKGEGINMNNIKEKAFNKLEKGRKKRSITKRVAVAAAVATLTVSTIYAKDIQKTLQSFFGKSTVYQTVVDGDAYYLPEKLALGDKYTLKYVTMSEKRLELSIESVGEIYDEWYEELNLSVAEPNGGKSYTGGGYGYIDNSLLVLFYDMPILPTFDLSLDDEVYSISLTKAENLAVDESLVVGVSEKSKAAVETSEGGNTIGEVLPAIANVAASRTDKDSGTTINIAVGFDDRNIKLNALGEEEKDIVFIRKFKNDENGTFGSGNGPVTKPLMAYDADNNAYELKIPPDAIGGPVTVFETDAAPETPLTLKVPAIGMHYEKEVDRITLTIPKEGEIELGKEIDFIIQKAVMKTIKRTSETTAEITFDLNVDSDKSVKIRDISAYSDDVIEGETTITEDTAVLILTFDKDTEEAELSFNWPYFIIEGDWSIELE